MSCVPALIILTSSVQRVRNITGQASVKHLCSEQYRAGRQRELSSWREKAQQQRWISRVSTAIPIAILHSRWHDWCIVSV